MTLTFVLWSSSLLGDNLKKTFYFDADSTSFTKDSKIKIFEGNVVAIAPGTLISADKITHNSEIGLINASGHTILISGDQVFIGEDLEFEMESQNITIKNAILVAKEVNYTRKIVDDLLGLTFKEIEFEAARARKLAELETDRRKYLEEYSRLDPEEKNQTFRMEAYIKLLSQIDSVSTQPNPWIINRPPSERKVFLRRRELWDKAKQEQTLAGGQAVGYFRLSGATIARRQGNDYSSQEVSWSPCRCEEGESPAWSIQSGNVEAQMQGYLDFYNPVIKVGDLPILYAPFLRLPLKNTPQSGFLVPSIGTQSSTGFVVGLPAYMRFSEQSDITFSPELLEKRGFRLGVESEYRFSESYKFQFEGEAIRDREWLKEAGSRTEERAIYRQGLNSAILKQTDDNITPGSPDEQRARLSNPSYWQAQRQGGACGSYPTIAEAKECLERELSSSLATPENEWRGKAVWGATRYFTPRLSLVTNGEIFSDHRYLEDLEVSKGFTEALAGVPFRTFATSRYRLNLDQHNFYLSVFGNYSDYQQGPSLWSGKQTPFAVKYRSRYFSLGGSGIYTSAALESRQIYDRKSSTLADQTDLLGGGRRDLIQVNTIAPFHVVDQIQTSLFLDLEGRSFLHPELPEKSSQIKTTKFGILSSLPVKGEAQVGDQIWKHDFSLNTSLAIRPFAERDGVYGELFDYTDESTGQLVKASDRWTWYAADLGVESANLLIPSDEVLTKQEKINFESINSWSFFKKTVNREFSPSKASSLSERAKADLQGWEEAKSKNGEEALPFGVSLINRVSYDRVKARKRKELQDTVEALRKANSEITGEGKPPINVPDLPEPWSELVSEARMGVYSVSLSHASSWNLYRNFLTKSTYGLGLSPFTNVSLSLGYELEKKPIIDSLGRFSAVDTRTRSIGTQALILKQFNAIWQYARKVTQDQPDFQYATTLGLEFLSTSDCWGINLVRKKEFAQQEQQASWRLELNVILLGEKRGVDMAAAALKAWDRPNATFR
jgi:hypothetical protein